MIFYEAEKWNSVLVARVWKLRVIGKNRHREMAVLFRYRGYQIHVAELFTP
jgi:hypothetical protein